ncbi:MAG: CAP domain-containing protein [Halanaerobiales bacterium]
MKFARSGLIVKLLIIILLLNFIIPGLPGNHRAEASFFSDNKDSIFTLVKGLAMLYIMSLFTGDSSEDEEEGNFLTSTIRNGLNFGSSESESETEEVEVSGGKMGLEEEMLNRINSVRQEEGLKPVQLDDRLSDVARRKAEDMVENDYFDHVSPDYGTPFDMLREADIGYSLAGENLAVAGSVDSAFEKLMDSPEHRDNILEKNFDRVGLGILESDSNQLTFVQLFIDSPVVGE